MVRAPDGKTREAGLRPDQFYRQVPPAQRALPFNEESANQTKQHRPPFPMAGIFSCFPLWELLYDAMRIISRQNLVKAGQKHPKTKVSLTHWESVARAAAWKTPLEAQAAFSGAKALNAERVRFEIGDGYRLIVAFRWDLEIAWIKFLGSHAEYDKINALTVSEY